MAVITIASVTIPGWRGNTSGISLHIYTNQAFTAELGTIYPQTVRCAPASLGTFYQTVACTVASSALTIPDVILDSTTDSPDNPSATFSCVLWDDVSGKQIQPFGTFPAFSLAPSPTSTTWAAIFASEAIE